MIFKFRIISSEVGDFVRDIEIRSDQSFYDLHMTLTTNLHYDNSQLASFFISNMNWEKELEITLFDISEGTSPNIRIMDKTHLDELIHEKKQRLLYVFDYYNERLLFIELMDIFADQKDTKYPVVTHAEGSPPPQILIIDNNFDDLDPDE
jgi:hypothetical protein